MLDAWISSSTAPRFDDTQSGSVSSVPPEVLHHPLQHRGASAGRRRIHPPAQPLSARRDIHARESPRACLRTSSRLSSSTALETSTWSHSHKQPHHVVGCGAAAKLTSTAAVRRHQPARSIRNEPRRPAGLITAFLTASCSPPRDQCIPPEYTATTPVRVDHFAPQSAQCNIAWYERLDV